VFLSVVILGRFTTETHAMASKSAPTRRSLHHTPGRELILNNMAGTHHSHRLTVHAEPDIQPPKTIKMSGEQIKGLERRCSRCQQFDWEWNYTRGSPNAPTTAVDLCR
jgi:hypothetical protein